MSAGGMTFEQFKAKLNSQDGYAVGASAKKAIAKMSWPAEMKDRARHLVDKHFAGVPHVAAPAIKRSPAPRPQQFDASADEEGPGLSQASSSLLFHERVIRVAGTALERLSAAKNLYPDLDASEAQCAVQTIASSLQQVEQIRSQYMQRTPSYGQQTAVIPMRRVPAIEQYEELPEVQTAESEENNARVAALLQATIPKDGAAPTVVRRPGALERLHNMGALRGTQGQRSA